MLPALVLAGQLRVPGGDLLGRRGRRDTEERPERGRPAGIAGQPAELVEVAADLRAHAGGERLGIRAVLDHVLAVHPGAERRLVEPPGLGEPRKTRQPGARESLIASDQLGGERVKRAVSVGVGSCPCGPDLRGALCPPGRVQEDRLEVGAVLGELGGKRLVVRAALLVPESHQRRDARADQLGVVHVDWQVDDEKGVGQVKLGGAPQSGKHVLPVAGRIERADFGPAHRPAPRTPSDIAAATKSQCDKR